jgi:hypothetical protein
VKPELWNDFHFWRDTLKRHDGESKTPDEMAADDAGHGIGNMAGMIRQTMQEKGILK